MCVLSLNFKVIPRMAIFQVAFELNVLPNIGKRTGRLRMRSGASGRGFDFGSPHHRNGVPCYGL